MAYCIHVDTKHVIERQENNSIPIQSAHDLVELLNAIDIVFCFDDGWENGTIYRPALMDGMANVENYLNGRDHSVEVSEYEGFKQRHSMTDTDIFNFLTWLLETSDQTDDTIYVSFY